jgi:hypothetical protein
MARLNINMTPELERAIQRLMRLRGIASESEAFRVAVTEAVERDRARPRPATFAQLRGAGLRAPVRTRARFANEDDLWK